MAEKPKRKMILIRDDRGDNGMAEFGTYSMTRRVPKGSRDAKYGERMTPRKIRQAKKIDAIHAGQVGVNLALNKIEKIKKPSSEHTVTWSRKGDKKRPATSSRKGAGGRTAC